MSGRTITITLPDALYERVQATATASSLSFDEVLAQSIALSLPILERKLSSDMRSELAALALLSDTALWNIAASVLDEAQQVRLEDLADAQKQRPLSTAEQSMLAQLMEEAQHMMICKAEAYRLLARRGHTVFANPETSSG